MKPNYILNNRYSSSKISHIGIDIDIDIDIKFWYFISFYMQPAPRVVKDPYSPVVYLLIDNKKCPFPD